ncbi:hypothetical protein [Hydrogenimonas sp.]|uniref:hypothetical protein n=1 Tax=Hydrogenimonas sp. TaxID=2231112 RepID=UPI00260FC91A|nr:hypothetical protein [Hydrogenimonas sp.]
MRRFKKLKGDKTYQYIDEESLLIYHPEGGRVYGFEKEMAAFVLHLDELIHQNPSIDLVALFPNIPKKNLFEIKKILSGSSIDNGQSYEPPLDTGCFAEDGKKRVHYAVSDACSFSIAYPDEKFFESIDPQFRHLQTENPTGRRINVDFAPADSNTWQLYFNARKTALPAKRETIPLILQENLIIAFYQSNPYLMAMHAGAVRFGDRSIILPGASGSGKSTLTAALTTSGFDLYSDEIALLGYDGMLTPIPFCMNIKEGSWKILEMRFDNLCTAHEHLRFDGQKVKFLLSDKISKKRGAVSAVVFPKYRKESACHVEPLTSCETLKRISESGYQLEQPLNEEHFELILNHLLAKPAYEMTYGSLDDAISKLAEIVNG